MTSPCLVQLLVSIESLILSSLGILLHIHAVYFTDRSPRLRRNHPRSHRIFTSGNCHVILNYSGRSPNHLICLYRTAYICCNTSCEEHYVDKSGCYSFKDIGPHNPQFFQIGDNGYIIPFHTFSSLTANRLHLAALHRFKPSFMKMNASSPSKTFRSIYVTSIIVNEQTFGCVCDICLL